jgi:hypothetical protein
MHLKDIAWEGIGSIDLAQDRNKWRALLKTVMNFSVPQKSMNLNRRWVFGFSRRTPLHGVR